MVKVIEGIWEFTNVYSVNNNIFFVYAFTLDFFKIAK